MVEVSKKFDIIVFGGTGYTGRYVIEELAVTTKSTDIKWAIAGRNAEKLKQSLEMVQKYLEDINILDIPIIIADVYDEKSIDNMCKMAKIIVNCVGPYKLYGEIVVSSCIKNKTHQVDLSGEIKYLETIQANYFQSARENGVYIISACGFDSIPSDYGSSVLKKKFPGDLNSVEFYVQVKQGPSGRKTNIGTLLSAIDSIRDIFSKNTYRRMLKQNVFKKEVPKNEYPLSWKKRIFYSDIVQGWCLPLIGAPDESVIERSQMFRYEYLNDRPIQVIAYANMTTFWNALLFLLAAGFVGFMALFSCGRYLLSKYPRCFTFGQFTTDGPTRQQVEEGKTIMTLVGHGWKNKLPNPTEKHDSPPDTKMTLTLSGPEITYPLSSMCLVQAALVILEETDKLPLEGGVLTPGIAFENTSLQGRLNARGLKFTFGKATWE